VRLGGDRQILAEPAGNFADAAERPRGREVAIPRFVERLEEAQPLLLAFDQPEADEAT
jgi:hypothetical protein